MHFFHSLCTEVSLSTRNTVQFIFTSSILSAQKSPSLQVTLFFSWFMYGLCQHIRYIVGWRCKKNCKEAFVVWTSVQDSRPFGHYGYGLDERGIRFLVPLGSRFVTCTCRPDRFWGAPSLLSNGCWGIFAPWIERPGRQADHSPPIIADVKKTWIHTSTAHTGTNLLLISLSIYLLNFNNILLTFCHVIGLQFDSLVTYILGFVTYLTGLDIATNTTGAYFSGLSGCLCPWLVSYPSSEDSRDMEHRNSQCHRLVRWQLQTSPLRCIDSNLFSIARSQLKGSRPFIFLPKRMRVQCPFKLAAGQEIWTALCYFLFSRMISFFFCVCVNSCCTALILLPVSIVSPSAA
jgi:hypothetical protein